MNSVLRFKRGTNAERLAYIPQSGEAIWTIDTNGFYIGNGVTLGGVTPTNMVGGPGGAAFTNSSEFRALLSDPSGSGLAVFTNSPTFTGTPLAPTATGGTNTTQIATTAFVAAAIAGFAPLAGPTFTGTVSAPTPTAGDNSTKVATTAFVVAGFATIASLGSYALSSALSAYAPLASPTFTGTPAVPTASFGTNSTQVASTAYVKESIRKTSTITYATSVTPDLANGNIFEISSITGALDIGAPTGTPANGDKIMFRLTFGAGASLPTWNAIFAFSDFDGAADDVIYTSGAVNRVMFMYSTLTSKWEIAGFLPRL